MERIIADQVTLIAAGDDVYVYNADQRDAIDTQVLALTGANHDVIMRTISLEKWAARVRNMLKRSGVTIVDCRPVEGGGDAP